MPREISEDLCWHVIYLFMDGFSTADIANTLYVSKCFVNKIKKDISAGNVLKILSKVFLVVESYLVEQIWLYLEIL